MKQFITNYCIPWTGITILFLSSIRSILNDILIGNLPGHYGKADKKAMCIREKLSFFERLTQRYIGQYVIEKYRTGYRFYMCLKWALVVYYLLGILALFVFMSIGETRTMLLLWKILIWTDALMGLFFITRFDFNHKSKYTRNNTDFEERFIYSFI